MELEPNQLEYQIFLILTIFVIIFKFILAIYLGVKLKKKNKNREGFKLDFLISIFILIMTLAISRIFYMYFDFFLTEFNNELYYVMPNILYWKLATFISAIGFVIVLYVIDKTVLSFKFKGGLALVLLVAALIQLLFPVDSSADFQFVSSFSFAAVAVGIVIPLIFLYIGYKTPGLRKVAFIMALGVIIYGIGGLLVGEAVLNPLRVLLGDTIHIPIFFIFLTTKIVGLSLLAWGVTEFSL